MTLNVSDLKRSVDFYQGLFGVPVQSRRRDTVILRIGQGPQFVALTTGGATLKPGIEQFCLTTEPFNVDRIVQTLAAHGITKADEPGAMRVWVRFRRDKAADTDEGTPEIYIGDPDALTVRIQHPTYCGGGGLLGNRCLAPAERSPHKGLLSARELNHFTLYVANQNRSTAFYQNVFGLPINVYQGTTPTLRVGAGVQAIAISDHPRTNGATPGTPNIAHACLSIERFQPDEVLKALANFGIKPRADSTRPAAPLMSYVVSRMPDRGGAKEGTPEIYFTDPDGILIQLQDLQYCGGSGYLGNVCR